MADTSVVLAAGCVLWRRSSSGAGVELALVYRPKWADWSHPKGKLKRGEDARDGALREVLEETGMACDLGPELPTAFYIDGQGRPKEVRYWAAEAAGGTFVPNAEVSRLVWLPPVEASELVTRERDAALISDFVAALRSAGEL
ncbi:MAG: NUDIX hydrolase [Streptomyces sp.]